MGMVEDCINSYAECGIARIAMMPIFFRNTCGILRFTIRAFWDIIPTYFLKIG